MKTIIIPQPDDWHIHLRDGDFLARTVPDAARQFHRAIVMPNLVPPVTTSELAVAYRDRILAELPADTDFEPLMTLYMTSETNLDIVKAAETNPHIHAFKLYPAGATTNSAAGVANITDIYPVLEAMQATNLKLLIHGEVTHGDIFDREARFLADVLTPIRANFPELKIVLEHITTADSVKFVLAAEQNLAATITPHHLLHNRNALLAGGIKPHYYCLPILKRERHQQALINAAISGDPRFFAGTDSAPHTIHSKQSACGCAGIYSAFSAIEWYATVFELHDALDKLAEFTSGFGADYYGLPRNQNTVTLHKTDWQLPDTLDFGVEQVKPLGAGETITWRLADE